MTPFGEKLRQLRRDKGVTLSEMAEAIGVTPTYLSALEHGKRGTPTWMLLQSIIGYFNIIWDEAEELQKLAEYSNPRITIYTAGLSPKATLLANELAKSIKSLEEHELENILQKLKTSQNISR